MKDNIEPWRSSWSRFFGEDKTKEFEGGFDGHTFRINRILDFHKKSFPVLTGVITNENDRVKICIKIRLPQSSVVSYLLVASFSFIFIYSYSIVPENICCQVLSGVFISIATYLHSGNVVF